MSPSASCAKEVMPTRTEPSAWPGSRSHSCSAVYFRSSGNTLLLEIGFPRRLLPGRGFGVAGLHRGAGHAHVDAVGLLDRHRAAVHLDVVGEAVLELQRAR